MRFICRVLLLKPPNYLTRVHSFKSVNVQWMLNLTLVCFQLNESKTLLKHVLQTSWKSSFINRFSYSCVRVLFFCLLCSIQKDFFFFYLNEIFLLSITDLDLKAQPLSRSEFEISLLPLGRFLKQYPGAAWVLPKDSSISDFVAGGDPSSPGLQFLYFFQ